MPVNLFRHRLAMAVRFLLIITASFGIRQAAGQSIKEELVSDSSARCVLKGTLLIPEHKAKLPVVLIIAGSGPTDRDGNSPRLKSDYLKLLAENLAANGIASLRYDKRGVAKSKYNGKEENVVFDDFALDAASWISRLKADPRFSKVIVMGHSEGSLLGMLAIQRSAADGFVSVAGAGRPIDIVLKEQLHANANNPASLIQAADGIIDSLKMGLQVKQVPMLLSGLFRPSVQPFLISWMKYDPAVEIKKLNMPVMIVHGTTDIQVSKADAEALRIAHSTATYQEVEGMNHVLRAAPADRSENIKTYFRPDLPLKEELIRSLTEFVQRIQ
ncbi:MAG: alpha/beta hydrolase family protein [Cyclobacteriaceae bacterium]